MRFDVETVARLYGVPPWLVDPSIRPTRWQRWRWYLGAMWRLRTLTPWK